MHLAICWVGIERMGTMDMEFADRHEAGHALARALGRYRGTDAVILGMARGGVVVAAAVAEDLDLPLQPLVVRKLGSPLNPELAIGAVSETGALQLDQNLIWATGAGQDYIERELALQRAEAQRRAVQYATGPQGRDLRGRTVLVVDDGVATGSSALVAIRSARDLAAAHVVLATPVASPQALATLEREADAVISLSTPATFGAVGLYYRHFDQVSDAEVVACLRAVEAARAGQ